MSREVIISQMKKKKPIICALELLVFSLSFCTTNFVEASQVLQKPNFLQLFVCMWISILLLWSGGGGGAEGMYLHNVMAACPPRLPLFPWLTSRARSVCRTSRVETDKRILSAGPRTPLQPHTAKPKCLVFTHEHGRIPIDISTFTVIQITSLYHQLV